MSVIIDAVLIVVAVIVLLVGTVRGFLNSSYKFLRFCSFVAACIFLMPLAVNALAKVDFLQKLSATFAGWFNKIGGYMTVEIFSADEAAEALKAAGIPSFLAGMGASAVRAGLSGGATSVTLGGMMGLYALKAVLGIVVVIVFNLLLRLIFMLLRKLLRALHKFKVFVVLDKIFGGVFCLALTGAFALLVLAELHTVSARIPKADAAIRDTAVTKAIYEKNPLQKLVDENLNIDKLIRSVTGK